MQRSLAAAAVLVLSLFACISPAPAFIKAEDYPLKRAIDSVSWIFTAKVQTFEPEKKTAVLVVGDSFPKKEKPDITRLPVYFSKPSDDGADEGHVAKILKRLAANQTLVVFVEKQGGALYRAMAYTNGTWFQMTCKDPAREPWRFLHCEIYLRGTFKGTTEEMQQVVLDYLSKGKEPPGVNPKEPPGLGPEVESKSGARPALPGSGGRGAAGPVFAVVTPVIGVIPTVAIGGPLAILSMLFPTLFGKPREVLRRYLALLTVASINSVVYIVHAIFEDSLKEYWWGTQLSLWTFMGTITILGMVWAWLRYRRVSGTAEDILPRRGEVIAFQLLSLAGLATAPYLLGRGLLFQAGGREVFLVCGVVWAGMLSILYFRWLGRYASPLAGSGPEGPITATLTPGAAKPPFSVETAMLTGLAGVCAVIMVVFLPPAPSAVADPSGPAPTDNGPRLVWRFTFEGNASMDSTPLVTDQHVYIAAKISGAFGTSGRLYCLDRATSKVVWTFDNDGTMKPVFSTPWLADGCIWIGEGYHQDQKCRLYCLDAATGDKIGQFRTKSHTESSPCVANGLVYFGAGDDGLYCINPKKKDDEGRFEAEWNYPHVHVDASPAVAGGRVYCGSGVGDIYRETAIFAVDAATGKEIWKIPTELPVWGSPVIDGDQVFFGIGNGNFIEDADRPAGALWCVDAATGRRRWIYPVANGVLARPAVDRANVYFTSRDGHCYAVDRNDGRLRWKRKFDSPVVTSPALVSCSHCGSSHQLYVAATNGQVSCLDPATGSVIWTYDVARHSGRTPQLFSSPRVLVQRQGSQARPLIYFGSGLGRLADWQAALYCLEDRGGSAPVAHADVK